MGAAIGDILGLAAGVAVSPLPIVAMILLLATPRGRANGSLFAVGWLAGLAVLGAVVLALAGPAGASSGGEPGPRRPSWPCSCWSDPSACSPLVVYLVAGDRAARTLDVWRTWAAEHNAAVMAVLFVIFGFKLVGDGIAVLS
jgi:Sap, sulfolipid-1-addressing protein